MNHKIYIISFFAISLSLPVGACNRQKKEIVIDNSCSPPCWRNITPGETDQAELIEILERMPEINKKSIHVLGPWDNFEGMVTASLNSGPEIEFNIEAEKVVLIFISGELDLTYSEAVEAFGDPDVITAAHTLGPGRLLFGDSPYLFISSIIPKIGVSFGFSTSDTAMESEEEIDPDSQLTNFIYFDPDAYKTLLDRGVFTMGNSWDFQFWRSNHN